MRLKNIQVVFLLQCFCMESLFANETIKSLPQDPVSWNVFWQLIMGLLLVLALVFALTFMLKRVWGLRVNNNLGMRVLAGLSLGQRERVIVIQIGVQRLVLGVAPGCIAKLHQLSDVNSPEADDELQAALHDHQQSGFASKLASLINKGGV